MNWPKFSYGGHRGHDHMVVRFRATCAISAYHYYSWEFESCSWRVVLDTLCDKVCQWLATSQWFLGFATNKTDCHNITAILLKMVLKHHNPNPKLNYLHSTTGPCKQDHWSSSWVLACRLFFLDELKVLCSRQNYLRSF